MRSPRKTSVPVMWSIICGKPGDAHLRVLELGGAGEARRVERAGQAAGDGDVAVGAQVGDEELQQRRFERRRCRSMLSRFAPVSSAKPPTANVDAGVLPRASSKSSKTMRPSRRPTCSGRAGANCVLGDADVELGEGGVDAQRLDRGQLAAELQVRR